MRNKAAPTCGLISEILWDNKIFTKFTKLGNKTKWLSLEIKPFIELSLVTAGGETLK